MIALDSAPATVSIITQFFFPIQNSLIDCFVACCPLEHCLDPKRKRLKECWRCLCPAQRQFQRFTSKTVKSEFGEFQLDIPRDRKGEFEPEIVPKYCRMCIKYPRSRVWAAPKEKDTACICNAKNAVRLY